MMVQIGLATVSLILPFGRADVASLATTVEHNAQICRRIFRRARRSPRERRSGWLIKLLGIDIHVPAFVGVVVEHVGSSLLKMDRMRNVDSVISGQRLFPGDASLN